MIRVILLLACGPANFGAGFLKYGCFLRVLMMTLRGWGELGLFVRGTFFRWIIKFILFISSQRTQNLL